MFDFDPSLTKPSVTFWSGLFGGAFLSLATHGVDQMIVQRYLCAKDQKSASWALGLSGFVVLAQFALFLLIGVALACFYSTSDTGNSSGERRRSVHDVCRQPHGHGLKGLILAAVLAATMSNLSSSFNSSASSFMSDWLGAGCRAWRIDKSLRLARIADADFGRRSRGGGDRRVRNGIAADAMVTLVLRIAGFSTGLFLGLYGLGLIAPRTREAVALVAFVVGTVVTCWRCVRNAAQWLLVYAGG